MNTALPSWIGPAAGFVLAPLLVSVTVRVKARAAGRAGPPLIQPYRDLGKWLRKGSVTSQTAGVLFRVGPAVALGGAAFSLCLVPPAGVRPLASFPGDLVALAYALAAGRFFMLLAALDTGSSFEGMGASRDAWFSALLEPAFLVTLAAIARGAGSDSLAEALNSPGRAAVLWIAAAALSILFLAENGRVPVDDPATHLELTMVHEVMALDHGGVDLAAIEYARALKFWVLASILAGLLPHPETPGFAIVTWLAGMMAVAVATGVVESTRARMRMNRVTQFLAGGCALALIAALESLR